jgi:hypothetical protein
MLVTESLPSVQRVGVPQQLGLFKVCTIYQAFV